MKKIFLLSVLLISLTACDPDAESTQRRKTRQLLSEAQAQMGMPAITNFQERKFAKQILELRDKEILTHSYIKNDLKGCLIYLGRSVGYGLPYSVQFTNPMKYEYNSVSLPQADPNGLYMPESASATWVLLYDETTKKTAPVYIESDLTISPFRLVNAECSSK